MYCSCPDQVRLSSRRYGSSSSESPRNRMLKYSRYELVEYTILEENPTRATPVAKEQAYLYETPVVTR